MTTNINLSNALRGGEGWKEGRELEGRGRMKEGEERGGREEEGKERRGEERAGREGHEKVRFERTLL